MTRARALTATLATTVLLGACSTMGTAEETTSGGSADDGTAAGEAGGPVVLVTHESFNLPKKLSKAFEEESGYELEVRAGGDAGSLATRLSLTAEDPTGDVAFGIDNTFASRPLEAGAFAEYQPELPEGAERYALDDGADRLTPIDAGDVCVNVDTDWFEAEGRTPPKTLDDLTDPDYEDLFVTPAASTSSPGMAFLLTTIAAYGDEWPDYWGDLMKNGTKVVDGWEDAYYGDFTAAAEKGGRPIVLSYDSSPAYTVSKNGEESSTRALLDTCFQQVEYMGVLEGAANPQGAEALVDFMLSEEVQAALPTSMYVFPVDDTVDLPRDWARFAEKPSDPYDVSPEDITANREQWLTEWTDVVTR